MNTIEAIIDKSDYEIYDDYLNFKIDKFWLDEKLSEICQEANYKGLVPTLQFWMASEEESQIVWHKILPEKNKKTICPILMCPDDVDFSCNLIVAEIENTGNTVKWLRLGIDRTVININNPEEVGSEVDWFDKIPTLEFDYNYYLEMIKQFKIQFEEDKLR